MSSEFDEMVKGIKLTAGVPAAESPKDPRAELFGKACAAYALMLPFLPLRAWLFMLGVGALHGALPVVPTVNFGASLLILLAVGTLRRPKS